MAAVGGGGAGEELVMEQKGEWPREGEATAREGWFRLGAGDNSGGAVCAVSTRAVIPDTWKEQGG
ncbi:hypothetical protein NC651_028947 [Populus alba x Populus x berolinensis]|nr:hypothetical protein NC651_028947 [Populus alba x Populus x berolinensis]